MLSHELRDKVLQYVNAEITLEELEDWLVPRLPEYLTFQPSTDAEVAGAIELGLAELSDCLITEDDLRRSLAHMLSDKVTAS